MSEIFTVDLVQINLGLNFCTFPENSRKDDFKSKLSRRSKSEIFRNKFFGLRTISSLSSHLFEELVEYTQFLTRGGPQIGRLWYI